MLFLGIGWRVGVDERCAVMGTVKSGMTSRIHETMLISNDVMTMIERSIRRITTSWDCTCFSRTNSLV